MLHVQTQESARSTRGLCQPFRVFQAGTLDYPRGSQALFDAVVSYGLEGIVAKRRAGFDRSGYRGLGEGEEPDLLAARVGDRGDAPSPGGRKAKPSPGLVAV